jgi:MFS family permease
MAANLRLGGEANGGAAGVEPVSNLQARPFRADTTGQTGRARGRGAWAVAEPQQPKTSVFRAVPGLAPMLAAASLARAGATMIGLTMGFVAYEQTESALIVAIVVSAFGLAFAISSLVAGHVLQRVGLRTMLVGALVSQIAGALVLASVTSTAGADVVWLTIFGFANGLASAFLFVGSQMLLHGLASSEHLKRVVSLDAGASLSRIAGPALGGVLLAVIGIPPVFLLVAVLYLPLVAVTAVLSPRVNDPEPVHRPRLREAARFYREVPLLRWAIVTAALAETLALPLVNMMPAVTESLNRDAADRLESSLRVLRWARSVRSCSSDGSTRDTTRGWSSGSRTQPPEPSSLASPSARSCSSPASCWWSSA